MPLWAVKMSEKKTCEHTPAKHTWHSSSSPIKQAPTEAVFLAELTPVSKAQHAEQFPSPGLFVPKPPPANYFVDRV